MRNNNDCKRCLLRESGNEDAYLNVSEYIAKIPENERTLKDEYEQRLMLCRSCDELISGVCMKCGCYAEFRAAFKNKKCPYVKNRRW